MPPHIPDGITHATADVGGVRLHYAEAGRGEPVVLLHGFPEFWYSWRHQLPALADAGFRAVAPDLRGYNESDRPSGVAAYRVARLVEDVAGLIRSLGGRACVVGHDWGGVLAWRVAALYPNLVRKLAILDAPHPLAFRRELRRDWRQCLRSAYTLFFQLPLLPEWTLRAGDFALMRRAWSRQPVHPGGFTADDFAAYTKAFGGSGGLTGPLNYYRAAMRYPADVYGPPQRVEVPTLLLWGDRDVFLGVGLTEDLGRWVPDLRVERIDASHWIQNDAPDRVNRSLIEFFGR